MTAKTSTDLEKHENAEFIRNNHAATMKLYDELAAEAKRLANTL